MPFLLRTRCRTTFGSFGQIYFIMGVNVHLRLRKDNDLVNPVTVHITGHHVSVGNIKTYIERYFFGISPTLPV
jgi:hypothetical protein